VLLKVKKYLKSDKLMGNALNSLFSRLP